mmetsp:Transcript_12914/g.12902  ORF Transcript_12914/g.12902 Transcript_12914/m.12902 type:complete len:207 (-) Transcript_12914:508-1128(-)
MGRYSMPLVIMPSSVHITMSLMSLNSKKNQQDLEALNHDLESTLDGSFMTISEQNDDIDLNEHAIIDLDDQWTLERLNNLAYKAYLCHGKQARISLVHEQETGRNFAQKVYQSRSKFCKKAEEEFKREVMFLTTLSHPFIIKFHYAAQEEQKYKILLDFCQGGDLKMHMNLIKRSKKFKFSERTIKFYIACIILALKKVHENDIVY